MDCSYIDIVCSAIWQMKTPEHDKEEKEPT